MFNIAPLQHYHIVLLLTIPCCLVAYPHYEFLFRLVEGWRMVSYLRMQPVLVALWKPIFFISLLPGRCSWLPHQWCRWRYY